MSYIGTVSRPAVNNIIPDNSITAAKIVDGAIVATDLADDSVTGAKIENNPTIAGNLTVSGDLVPSTPLSHRNMIINGGMQVWQRATAATAAGNPTYDTVDRFRFRENTDGAYTSQKHTMSVAEQNTTGHATALQLDVTTADAALTSAQYAYLATTIEAQDCQHLQYGTANAKTLILSFWVKSNKTGTYTISVRKQDTTQYVIPIEYTISSADTWEKKTITISPTAGSTSLITSSAGVIDNDNGEGLQIGWSLIWGDTFHTTNNVWTSGNSYSTSNQVNWMDSTSNNFYLTGVQLELGSSATPFEHRSYGEELARCKRYYQEINNTQTTARENTSTRYRIMCSFPVEMRATPTLTRTSNNLSFQGSATSYTSSNTTHQQAGEICATSFVTDFAGFSGLPDGGTSGADINHAWNLDAEL